MLGPRVRKDACLPREISRAVLDRRVRGELTGGSSNSAMAEPRGRNQSRRWRDFRFAPTGQGIVVGGNEP